MQRTQQYHSDHPAQEQNDNQRVQDTEPLDVRVRHRFEDVVPSGGPLDVVVLHEMYRVSVQDAEIVFQIGRGNLHRELRIAIGLSRTERKNSISKDSNMLEAWKNSETKQRP